MLPDRAVVRRFSPAILKNQVKRTFFLAVIATVFAIATAVALVEVG
jgi:hypothetical protein